MPRRWFRPVPFHMNMVTVGHRVRVVTTYAVDGGVGAALQCVTSNGIHITATITHAGLWEDESSDGDSHGESEMTAESEAANAEPPTVESVFSVSGIMMYMRSLPCFCMSRTA